VLVAFTLAMVFLAPRVIAHAQTADLKTAASPAEPEIYQTFHLNNITQQSEFSEIMNAVRNMLPNARIYAVEAQNVISVKATRADMELAQKMIAELDRVRKTYRLTYTLTDLDGSKHTGSQSFSLIVVSGEKATLKQGGRVPIVTGNYDLTSQSQNSQVQYLDVGMNIDASAQESGDGVRLHSKLERSSLADEKSGVGPQDPIVHQAVWESTTILAVGKPRVLGSINLLDSTRNQEVSVVAELIK
jgi:type II secretory pathway component GspD/PulD (secretin)